MKLLTPFIAMIVLSISLSSCALLVNKQLKRNCANASYVYGDLSSKTVHRYYLPNGQVCPQNSREEL